ncbi:MAG: HD domain-containing protein [Defluviitaleaceae bacterium]|nr:HD domain-containing protein [Defluviitaleaceae bacterium]
MRYIEDFKEDDRIVAHYLCKQKQSLRSRAGKTYLSLKLQDKTGIIDGKVWELSNDIQSFEENDYIKVDGTVVAYQNDLQMKISKIRRSEEGEYDPADYVPRTDKDVEALYDSLLGYIKSIDNSYIKRLLESIFLEDSVISTSIKTHSAAKQMHHSYMGGLLEHTVCVADICEFLAGKYKFVDRDMLIAGALLHDVCKIIELSPFPVNDYTDDGQLIGHLVMGSELAGRHIDKIEGFPHQLGLLIKHMLLSHHGTHEFGSPVLPKTVEAFLLNCADDLDAKTKMFEDAIVGDNTMGMWVGYHRMFGRNLRKSGYNNEK